MRIDVNTSLGGFPWRRLPETTVPELLAAMERTGITGAWVFHLPALLWRDPMDSNDELIGWSAADPRLVPVPCVHPGLPRWQEELVRMHRMGARIVRADPTWYGLAPAGNEMQALAQEVARLGMVLMLAVRLEDGRQRHPLDQTAELPASAVRALIREDPRLRLLVTHADRAFIEEVHFGSTPEEAARLWWDISWVWGPPEDHLETLLETVGPSRFVFGSGQPLRLPENPVARLDLLDLPSEVRAMIESGNARALLGAS